MNLGASMGTVKTDFNAAPVTVVTDAGAASCKCFTTPGFAGSNTESPDGFIGGGQIGYNYQFSPIWVVGLEADFQGAAEKDHNTLTNPFSFPFVLGTIPNPNPPPTNLTVVTPVAGSTVLDYSAKIEWFGTARLRAGYVWGNGNVFSYFTGGLAYGKVDLEGTSTVSGTVGGIPALPFPITHTIGHSNVNTGWTVDYGTEGRLGNSNWTWKVESLYMDLGHLNDTDKGVATPTIVESVTGGLHEHPFHRLDSSRRAELSIPLI